jgi:2-hydroxy-6-oxo-octa-2,4-dienoate hydrolase
MSVAADDPSTLTQGRPEIGVEVVAGGVRTNVLRAGQGDPVLLVHGSGPGVTAYANWRLTIPALSQRLHVVAPDMLGFGFTERPKPPMVCDTDRWVRHLVDLLDALELPAASVVGNSFGGAIALRLAASHPERVKKLVLMGSVGVPFDITEGLDAVWGYQPSLSSMRSLLDIFAYSRELVTDELAEVRYRASIEPGFQEAFSALFPPPRQRWVDEMATPTAEIRRVTHETLVVHGRDDLVIPLQNSIQLTHLLPNSQLHVFGRCGHWTQIEWSRDFNRLVGDFLTQ